MSDYEILKFDLNNCDNNNVIIVSKYLTIATLIF